MTPEDEVPLNTSRAHDGPLDEDEKERIRLSLLEDSESGKTKIMSMAPKKKKKEKKKKNLTGIRMQRMCYYECLSSGIETYHEYRRREGKCPKSLKERQLALIGAEVRNVMEEAERDLHDREGRFLEETRR